MKKIIMLLVLFVSSAFSQDTTIINIIPYDNWLKQGDTLNYDSATYAEMYSEFDKGAFVFTKCMGEPLGTKEVFPYRINLIVNGLNCELAEQYTTMLLDPDTTLSNRIIKQFQYFLPVEFVDSLYTESDSVNMGFHNISFVVLRNLVKYYNRKVNGTIEVKQKI